MKRILILPIFLLAFALQAQTSFYSEFHFTDTIVANHPLTLTVHGYWDSLATTNSGPYTQTISTQTNTLGSAIDTIIVPANVLDLRTSYTYIDCLGNTQSTGVSPIVSVGNFPSFNVNFCQNVVPCNYTHQLWPDTTNMNIRAFTGQVIGPNYPHTRYYWYMGDGTTYIGANINHTYSSPGVYTVITQVILTNSTGTYVCVDFDTTQVTAPSGVTQNCDADFSYSISGLSISVNANSSSGNHYFMLDNTTYQTSSFTHVFSGPGTYSIYAEHSLSTVAGSCSDTVIKSVTVNIPTYAIRGSLNSLQTNDTAIVYLIDAGTDSATGSVLLTQLDQQLTDTAGFTFSNLSAGTYYVKAALTTNSPSYNTTLPTYYGDELLWSNASPIVVGPLGYWASINLITGINPGGPGFIGGLVIQGANKTMNGGPWDVFLTTDQDVPVAYRQTDGNNQYGFNNLAYGTYKVFVEVPGSQISPHLVTLDASNPGATGISFEADSLATGPLGLSENNSIDFALFPNPAKDAIQVELNKLIKGEIMVAIFDTKGVEVFTKTINASNTNKTIEVSLSNWDNGLYIVRLSQGNAVTFKKMQKF